MKIDISLTALAVISFCAADATAGVLYAVDYPSSATLYTVNEGSGALTTVGPVGLDNVGDLTSDGVSMLWGIQITTNSLVSINATTGAGTAGPVITGTAMPPTGGPAFPIVSLAFDPLTDMLYGNTSVPYGGETADELYSINPLTGLAADIGTIGENSVYALGFSQTGQLFGVDGNCNLINISTTTGVGTIVGATGLEVVGTIPGCAAYDLASDGSAMYLANTPTSSLYTVNLTTGAASLVGPYGDGSPNIVGLAVLGTPEPSTIELYAASFGLLALARRRRIIG
jgi:hypothetical protein